MQELGCSCCSDLRLIIRLRKFGRIEGWGEFARLRCSHASLASPKFVELTRVRSKWRRAWSGVCERRRILRVTRFNVLRWPRLRRSKEQLLRSQDVALLVATFMAERVPIPATPNPSIEGTSNSGLRPPLAAPHVKR